MEMISTSRFKKAYNRSVGTLPYTETLAKLVGGLAANDRNVSNHPLLKQNDNSKKVIMLVLTSSRGLCGGYNGNVLRVASRQIENLKSHGMDIDLRVSGRKGIHYFKFMNQPVSTVYMEFDDKTDYAAVEPLARDYIESYTRGELAGVQVVYTRFHSASRFEAEMSNLLPLVSLEYKQGALSEYNAGRDEYIFSPSAEEILQQLIPLTVCTQLFKCFTDSIVCEQIARMRSMKAASDNAEKMISELTRQYNRARQGQITNELLDIMGGVEAMK
jgi:F-type H+-transporting ATPase subunit gamma